MKDNRDNRDNRDNKELTELKDKELEVQRETTEEKAKPEEEGKEENEGKEEKEETKDIKQPEPQKPSWWKGTRMEKPVVYRKLRVVVIIMLIIPTSLMYGVTLMMTPEQRQAFLGESQKTGAGG